MDRHVAPRVHVQLIRVLPSGHLLFPRYMPIDSAISVRMAYSFRAHEMVIILACDDHHPRHTVAAPRSPLVVVLSGDDRTDMGKELELEIDREVPGSRTHRTGSLILFSTAIFQFIISSFLPRRPSAPPANWVARGRQHWIIPGIVQKRRHCNIPRKSISKS